MKNLKKALVLVLAFAMVFGMFTIGASAATSFNDDEDIVNKEAVSAMTQLGIINGYDDGTFLPKENVTRAQMCKMICVALNGGTAPLLDADVTVFSDTKGHWASAYINYCYAEGIVSGDSGKGGPFRPDAAVTALEAAKMMLVALGYNAQIAGFTGADWAQNVAKEANRKGLFDGIGALNANAPLTRDNAAQLIFNGINADLVDYDNTLVTVDGQLTTVPKIKDLTGKTIITESYKAIKVEGVVTENEFNKVNYAGKTTIVVTNDEAIERYGTVSAGAKTSGPAVFSVSTGADVIGKAVSMYVKPSVSTPNNSVNATVIGKPTVSSVNTVFFTAKEVTDYAKTLAAAGLKIDDSTYPEIYENYVKQTRTVTNDDFKNTDGVEAYYIDNDGDGIVDIINKVTYGFGKVAKAGATDFEVTTLSSVTGFTSSDAKTEVVGFANLGLAKDDYVKFFEITTNKYYVEKVTGVTVDVTAKKGTDSIIASGKTYKASNFADASFDIQTAVALGKSATLFLDSAGNVIYATTPTAAPTVTKYLMLLQVASSSDPFTTELLAKVVYDDGTTGTVKIAGYDLYDGDSGASNPKTVGAATSGSVVSVSEAVDALDDHYIDAETLDNAFVFSYTVDDDGKYTIVKESATAQELTSGTNGIKKSTPEIASGIVADNKTTIVIKNLTGDAFVKYDGIDKVTTRLGDSTAALRVVAVKDATSGIAKVIFAYGGKSSVTTDTEKVYLLDTDVIETVSGDKTVYYFKVLRNGVVEEVKAKNATVFGTSSVTEGVYTVTYENGVIDSASKISSGVEVATQVKYAGNGIVGNQTSTHAYDDNTMFFIIKNHEATQATVSDIVTTGTKDDIAIIVDADTGVAKYVFIVRT